ncbi:MAG: type II toxin-antitoxin system YafO family toxin [Methylococcaceae bacterium]
MVKVTAALKTLLKQSGICVDEFCNQFIKWKNAGEYSSYYFGKDSAYVAPTVDGEKYKLRHVHLVPLIDQKQLAVWNKKWQFGGRKTSDRVLIYVEDNRNNFLLIFILSEPDAHKIAQMKELKHEQLMKRFASVSEQFMFDGTILA